MGNISVSVIVVSYNTKALTLECLRSLFIDERLLEQCEVIVYDNNSQDGSAEAIKYEFGDKITLIESKCNLGFAAGNNSASKYASSQSAYILLLNPDTIVLPRAISKLIDFAKSYPDAGIWGGRTLYPDGRLNPASCWGHQSVWSLFCQVLGLSSVFSNIYIFNTEGLGGWDRLGIRQVEIVSGCYLLISHQLWIKLEGFLPNFFMYGEDADLCMRASLNGARPMITSESAIIHYGGASDSVKEHKMVKLLKAKRILIEMYMSNRIKRIAIVLLYMWPLSRYYLYRIMRMFSSRYSFQENVWGSILSRKSEWLCLD